MNHVSTNPPPGGDDDGSDDLVPRSDIESILLVMVTMALILALVGSTIGSRAKPVDVGNVVDTVGTVTTATTLS